jgi:hypothetical protein
MDHTEDTTVEWGGQFQETIIGARTHLIINRLGAIKSLNEYIKIKRRLVFNCIPFAIGRVFFSGGAFLFLSPDSFIALTVPDLTAWCW